MKLRTLCILFLVLPAGLLPERSEAQLRNQENHWLRNTTFVGGAAALSDAWLGNPWLGGILAQSILIGARWETMRYNGWRVDLGKEAEILLPPLVVGISVSRFLIARRANKHEPLPVLP